MKIVITGGLGYIGTELCKLYSGQTRQHDITVIDNRFISERVKQLQDWGIHFIHGDILNHLLITEVLRGAHLIYHLAGITDVAYTKFESDSEKDKLITDVGVTGTRLILSRMESTAKIVFPSTHVVFEGLCKENITDLLMLPEEEPLAPKLTYARGKAQSEEDIKNSGRSYVIARLGSVYGYSTDTMRINIMPNLFSKIASQGGTIKLFADGVQIKSLVHVVDVARALKWLGEETFYRETFHLSSENMSVRQVAEICKKHNSDCLLQSTNDPIPNLGYTLSNHKLLACGFRFLHNIGDAIEEMVTNWKERPKKQSEEKILQGEDKYIDERGEISNYELPEPINLIGLIYSESGAIRANHFHPIQEQKCLLISGEYISVTKDLLFPNATIKVQKVRPGDLSIIPPNVAHAMIFTKDSVFVNLVNGERKHKNYGVTHTIPYELVNENLAAQLTQ
jgi:UDP-glucose 4-epimerase